MSAQAIHDTAPLGALIRYSDGEPRPPAHFVKKLKAWRDNNGIGRLIRKDVSTLHGAFTMPASITLYHGDFSSAGTILFTVQFTYSLNSKLAFEIINRPAHGSVLILHTSRRCPELLHVAPNRGAAEAWLRANPYPGAVLEETPIDASAPSQSLGRVA
jgi:hypothetical protein